MSLIDYRDKEKVVYDGRRDLPLGIVAREVPKVGKDFSGRILMARRVPGFYPKCPICRSILKQHPRYAGIAACFICPRLIVLKNKEADFWRDRVMDLIYHCWVKEPSMIPGRPHRGVDISWPPMAEPCVLCALNEPRPL